MRRIMLVTGVLVVAVVLSSATAGQWLLRGKNAGGPESELLFTRHVEVDKITSENGIEPVAVFPEDLYIVGVDGSNRRLLARNAAEAAVSPNGRRIAFARDGGVWIMERDGSHAKRLVKAASTPAWSPDGKTIYFARWVEADLGASLFSIREDGTHLVRLTHAKGMKDADPTRPHGCFQYHSDPSPAPDGRSLAFTEQRNICDGLSYIGVVSADGHPLQMPFRLLSDGRDTFGRETFSANRAAAWSPDGRQLAYSHYGRAAGLYVSRTDRSPPLLIADGGVDNPAWSPEREWIAFVSARPPETYYAGSAIELVRVDGSHRRTVTRPTLACADLFRTETPTPPTRCSSYSDPAWLPAYTEKT